ncbi:MAG: hypothetical protein ACI9KE_004272 [Polyangiales bacterium]|jgi:hypothetical protein
MLGEFMGIGCTEKRAWIYGPRGLVCDDGEEVRAVLDAAALGFDADNSRAAILSVHTKGGHLVSGEGELLAFDTNGAVRPDGRRVYALSPFDDEKWALATREGREVVVRIGRRGSESLRLRSPRGPIKVPVKLQWKGDEATFTRRKRLSETPGRLRLSSSDSSLVLADADAGLVALWVEGDMDWRFALRFPTNTESDLDAHPYRGGVIVALRSDSGHGALLFFDAEGTLQGNTSAERLGACATDDEGMVFADGPYLRRWIPGEGAVSILEAECLLNGGGEIVVAPDGRFLFQENERAYWLERDPEQPARWYSRAVPEPTNKAQPMVVSKKKLVRKTKSPPQLELDAMLEPQSWSFDDGDAELVFHLVTTGGAAEGLVVEVGGAGARLFIPETLTINGAVDASAAFKGVRAVATCTLPAGIEIPTVPKPVARRKADAKAWRWAQHPDDCRVTLRVRGIAAKGSALLTIRIGFAGHARVGSLLRGQTLVVGREPDPEPQPEPETQP